MRNLRGRDQEKVGKRKEELWGRRSTASSFVIALWPLTPGEGPMSTDVGDWMTSVKGFFISDYVCNKIWGGGDSDPPLGTCFFADLLTGRKYSDFSGFLFSSSSSSVFLPKHCDCVCEGYTLYWIYATQSPAHPAGVCLALELVSHYGQGWRRWWTHGGEGRGSNLLWFCLKHHHRMDFFFFFIFF